MYEIKLPLTIGSIEKFISHWDIFSNYITNFPGLDTSFRSQMRNDDKIPSCRVISVNGSLLYKDFSKKGMLNCYSYVAERFGLSFIETLGKIRNDFNLIQIQEYNGKLPTTKIIIKEQPVIVDKQETILLKKSRKWQLHDKEYWFDRYGITSGWLTKANVEPISSFWIKNHKFNLIEFSCSKYSYVYNYYWHNNIFRRKIYQPFSESFKWISNVDSTIVQGWDLLPKEGGDILIITSSYKDVGTIECTFNPLIYGSQIYAVAPNTEETFILPRVFEKLKRKWKNILLWYNNDFDKNDNTGLRRSMELSKEYNIPYLLTPSGTKKDPSDFHHYYGKDEFIRMTLNQINECI